METIRGYKALHRRLRSPVVAIGNFDGVHRGHAHIFQEAKRLARRIAPDAEAVVLTFEPHPAKVLAPAYAPPLITPLPRKLELIAAEGIDVTVVQPFDREFAGQSPESFVDQVLVAGLGARAVCVGYDFTFGQKRAGTVDFLRELGRTRSFDVHVIPAFTADGMVCSSTKVREFVLEGRVDGARLVLGRAPEVEGEVVRGDGRGRTIGVPTANLRPETELLPKNGVYAGWAELEDGRRFGAAINVGTNPTFVADQAVRVEAHLLDATDVGELYGKRLRLGFLERLRAEERFPSAEALVTQIRKDIDAARSISRAQRG
jgi:riboflavin kinase/FMN adenylyltransferase